MEKDYRRLYAIFDIHGRFDLLSLLLSKMDEDGMDLIQDKLVFCGDYIDRGPDSSLVVAKVRKLQEKYPGRVICLRGNHEQMAIDAIESTNGADFAWWAKEGGLATLRSFHPNRTVLDDREAIPEDAVLWMKALPLFHKEYGFFFSHAPLPRENRRQLLWRGTPYRDEEYIWTRAHDEFGVSKKHEPEPDGTPVIGVNGHNQFYCFGEDKPRIFDHYISGDTGCGVYSSAPLSCVEVVSRKIIQASPKELNPPK